MPAPHRHTLSIPSLVSLALLAATHQSLAQCTNTFTALSAPSPAAPTSPLLIDITGDGKLDIVSASYTGNTISVSAGFGDGTFSAPVYSNCGGTGPFAIAARDLNGDGKLDLVVINNIDNTIRTLLGGNSPSLSLGPVISSGANPSALCIVNLNNDSFPDLVVTNAGSDTVDMFLGVSGGGFTPMASYPTQGHLPNGIVAADFNGDGKIDIGVSNYEQFSGQQCSVTLFLSGGATGGLIPQPPIVFGLPLYRIIDVRAGDLNNDGMPDLVLITTAFTRMYRIMAKGPGTFDAPVQIPLGTTSAVQGIKLADLNEDGKLDLVTYFDQGGAGQRYFVRYAFGNGNGTFSFTTTPTAVSAGMIPLAVGDVNLDGRIDVLAANGSANTMQVFLNQILQGPGTRVHPARTTTVDGTPANFTVVGNGNNLTYQWRRNFVNLADGPKYAGVNTPTLTIQATRNLNLDLFDVIITNTCGTTTSNQAALEVLQCPGDFNDDGTVDFFDYLDFVAAFSVGC